MGAGRARIAGHVPLYQHGDGIPVGFLDPAAVAFDNDSPVGTSVDWELTYDDSFLGLTLSDLFNSSPNDVSGSLQVGTAEYVFDSMRFFSLTFSGNTITAYRPQVAATGPGTSDGGDFFAMFFSWGPDLSLVAAPMIGFGYSNDFSTTYGYLVTAGEYSVGPASQVPEPSTALLAVPALLLLRRRLRA